MHFQGYGSLGKLGHELLEFGNKNSLSPKSSKFPFPVFEEVGPFQPLFQPFTSPLHASHAHMAVLAAQIFQVVLLENPCAKETIKKEGKINCLKRQGPGGVVRG